MIFRKNLKAVFQFFLLMASKKFGGFLNRRVSFIGLAPIDPYELSLSFKII